MASSLQPKKNIFDLPQELRDIIYDFTFTRTVDLSLSHHSIAHSNGSLFLTSRQIHIEIDKLYYKNMRFYATNIEKLYNWIIALPLEYAQAIRTIRCSFDASWILEMLWDSHVADVMGLALMLADNKVLKSWQEVEGEWQWAASEEWEPPSAVFGTTQARTRAIP